MSASASFLRRLLLWIDDVARGLARLGAVLRRGRKVELIEQADGSFLAAECRKGAAHLLDEPPLRLEQDSFVDPISARMRTLLARSRVDVLLAPSRFIVRALELPRGANQFLEGIVRSQIDRLTPWSASDAVFGWSSPVDAGPDRIAIAVAATASALVDPMAQALVATRVEYIRMSTPAGDEGTLAIPVFAQRAGCEDDARRLRHGLTISFGLSGLAFAISFGAWLAIGGAYETHLVELQNQIAERRTALLNHQDSGADQAVQGLQVRKRAAPSAVMTLEALSKTLPDDTHLTELHIEDGKVQIVGVVQRRACANPAYRAVPAPHAGDIFRAYGQRS